MDTEDKTSVFLSAISRLYKDTLPTLSQQINLERQLLQDPSLSAKGRCMTHCPECCTQFQTGDNCVVRRRSGEVLKRLQSDIKLRCVNGCDKVILRKRHRSYWTIRCRVCRAWFVDLSANRRAQRGKKYLSKKKINYSKQKVKTKIALSRKKRSKIAKMERTKKKLITKRSVQIKPKSLKDFLMDCDLKLDS